MLSKLSFHQPSDFYNIINSDKNLSDLYNIVINNNVYYIEECKTKCILFKQGAIIYIVFNTTLDYNTEKKLTKIYKNIKVHKGVFEQFAKIEMLLYKNILKLIDNKTLHICVCGYSVSGTLSSIASAFIADKYKNIYNVSCITFAAPKPGNIYFKKYFNTYVNISYRLDTEDTNNYYHTVYRHISNTILIDKNYLIEIKKEAYIRKWSDFFCKEKSYNPKSIDIYVEYLKNIYNTSRKTSLNDVIN